MKYTAQKFIDNVRLLDLVAKHVTTYPFGVQYQLQLDDKFIVSVVQNEMSYGGQEGLYELGLWNSTMEHMITYENVTSDDDTVCGWLTSDDVDERLRHLITAENIVEVTDLVA